METWAQKMTHNCSLLLSVSGVTLQIPTDPVFWSSTSFQTALHVPLLPTESHQDRPSAESDARGLPSIPRQVLWADLT